MPEIERVETSETPIKTSPFLVSAQSEAVGLVLGTGGAEASHQVAFLQEAPRAPCSALAHPDQNPLAAWRAARAQVHTRTSENVQTQNSETLTGELLSHITAFWEHCVLVGHKYSGINIAQIKINIPEQ